MPHSRVGDVHLHYELIDCTEPWKPGRPPVLFIHGMGGDRRMWFYQIPEFCSRFATLTVDLRGHGMSSRPDGEWTIADMARDLVRLLRNLGAEKAHLVGLSLGGMVAQQFALDYPYATASLVLADTAAGTPVGFEGEMQKALQFIEANSMSAVATERITRAFSDAVDPALRAYFVDQVAHNDKSSYVRTARALAQFSAGERLGEIPVSTLVVVGEEDRVTAPALSEDLAARIPGARLVRIPGAGHISNIERPREFNRAVLDFLED